MENTKSSQQVKESRNSGLIRPITNRKRAMSNTKQKQKHLATLLQEQDQSCFFCGRYPIPEPSIEHLVATSLNGENTLANTVACCTSLNRRMGNISLKDKIRLAMAYTQQTICPHSNPNLVLPPYASTRHSDLSEQVIHPPTKSVQIPNKTVQPPANNRNKDV